MTIRHHPDAATLVAYAAGAASEAVALVVACHLAYCGRCRYEAANAEMIGGLLLDAIVPAAVSARSRNQILARLDEPRPLDVARAAFAANAWMPAPLRPYLDADWRQARWRRLAPGIRHLPLVSGPPERRGTARLVWAAPGRGLPSHFHGGSELTLVLAGSFSDHIGRFAPGDVSELDGSVVHRPVAGPEGDCICLLASEGDMKPVGRLARMLMRRLDL